MNSLPDEFVLYFSDFNKLCRITINVIVNNDTAVKYACSYADPLIDAISHLDIDHSIDPEDIVQEIALIWIKFIKKYKETQPNISMRQYLIRMSIWSIRDWVLKEAHTLLKTPIIPTTEEERISFSLDLSFLLYGSCHPLLRNLNSYERYLLYLRFKEDKHIFEVAKHLKRDRNMVASDFIKLYDKIRSTYENTSRYSC